MGDLQDKTFEKCVDELLKLLQKLKAKIKCFEHNTIEAKKILNRLFDFICDADSTPEGRMKQSYYRLISDNNANKSFVLEKILNFEKIIASKGIEIEENPQYHNDEGISDNRYQSVIDEKDFGNYLCNNYIINKSAYADNKNQSSLKGRIDRDVKSIAAILRLRKGKIISCFEQSIAIFITDNRAIDKCAREYFQKDESFGSRIISPSIHYFDLTSLLWIKIKSFTNCVPENELASVCNSILKPEPIIWDMVMKKVTEYKNQGFIDSNSYYTLKTDIEYQNILQEMRVMEDNPDITSLGTIMAVLKRGEEEKLKNIKNELDKVSNTVTEKDKTIQEQTSIIEQKDDELSKIRSNFEKESDKIAEYKTINRKLMFCFFHLLICILPTILIYFFQSIWFLLIVCILIILATIISSISLWFPKTEKLYRMDDFKKKIKCSEYKKLEDKYYNN